MNISLTDYRRLHKWAERKWVKSGRCLYCKKFVKTQWSNINHQYKWDREEWQEVCPKCHEAFDKAINGKKMGRKTPEQRYGKKAAARLKTYAWFKG